MPSKLPDPEKPEQADVRPNLASTGSVDQFLYELINASLFAALFLFVIISAYLIYIHLGRAPFFLFIIVIAGLRLALDIYRIDWMERQGRLDELLPPKPGEDRDEK